MLVDIKMQNLSFGECFSARDFTVCGIRVQERMNEDMNHPYL